MSLRKDRNSIESCLLCVLPLVRYKESHLFLSPAYYFLGELSANVKPEEALEVLQNVLEAGLRGLETAGFKTSN